MPVASTWKSPSKVNLPDSIVAPQLPVNIASRRNRRSRRRFVFAAMGSVVQHNYGLFQNWKFEIRPAEDLSVTAKFRQEFPGYNPSGRHLTTRKIKKTA